MTREDGEGEKTWHAENGVDYLFLSARCQSVRQSDGRTDRRPVDCGGGPLSWSRRPDSSNTQLFAAWLEKSSKIPFWSGRRRPVANKATATRSH